MSKNALNSLKNRRALSAPPLDALRRYSISNCALNYNRRFHVKDYIWHFETIHFLKDLLKGLLTSFLGGWPYQPLWLPLRIDLIRKKWSCGQHEACSTLFSFYDKERRRNVFSVWTNFELYLLFTIKIWYDNLFGKKLSMGLRKMRFSTRCFLKILLCETVQ